jgi:hypothetical protein
VLWGAGRFDDRSDGLFGPLPNVLTEMSGRTCGHLVLVFGRLLNGSLRNCVPSKGVKTKGGDGAQCPLSCCRSFHTTHGNFAASSMSIGDPFFLGVGVGDSIQSIVVQAYTQNYVADDSPASTSLAWVKQFRL